ncbi:MAG: ABC-2 transporter permease, partial [Candidatus Aminicenantes bacterium]|nr:ABC-2 transporter permease [Candidatus Aminicenantes bacterium]
MLRLMQKNSFYFLFYALVWIPIFILAVVLPGRPLDTGMVFFEGMWIILILLGSTITCEQNESKTRGYDFLKTLPVKDSQIVKAKFSLVFLTACFVSVYVSVIYLFVSKPPNVFAFALIFIPLCVFVGLLLTALLYILIFKIGLSKAIKIGWIAFFGVVIGTILFIEFVLVKSDINSEKMSAFIQSIPLVIWISSGLGFLVGYFLLMSVAIKAKEKARG